MNTRRPLCLVCLLASAIATFILPLGDPTVASQNFVSASGDMYFFDDSLLVWCIADSADTAFIDTTLVFATVWPDSTLTDSTLTASGFPDLEILDQCQGLCEQQTNMVLLRVPQTRGTEALLDSLADSPYIDYCGYDVPMALHSYPYDTYFDFQWGMHDSTTFTQSGWDLASSSAVYEEPLIAILDTGRPTHSDLAYPAAGSDFTEDTEGHATAVAGIIAAISHNSQGVAGLVSGGPILSLYNTYCRPGFGGPICEPSVGGTAISICRAIDKGASIINISAGSTNPKVPQKEIDCITGQTEEAADNDILIVASSGQWPSKYYGHMAIPADLPNVFGVAAVLRDGGEYGFFTEGATEASVGLDVRAPGGAEIYTTSLPLGSQGAPYTCVADTPCFGGTSASAPFVAGVAGLVRAVKPDLSWLDIRDIIRHSATKVGEMNGQYYTDRWGYGVVNTLGAVAGALLDAQVVLGEVPADTTLPSAKTPFSNLYLPADLVVPADVTVTIRAGTTVYVAAGDSAHAGEDEALVELVVEGRLVASSVEFVSYKESASITGSPGEGDWYGIRVANGTLEMDSTVVKHTSYGVLFASNDTSWIRDCTFASNELSDLYIGAGDSMSLVVEDNTFNVGGGYGIRMQTSFVSGVAIQDNTFQGSSASSAGIYPEILTSGATPQIVGNTLSGFSAGSGIKHAQSDAVYLGNTVTGNKWGFYVTGGSASIGDGTSANQNLVDENTTTGILAVGAGATPVIRYNKIRSNAVGVQAQSGACPDLGQSSADRGNNTMTGNSSYCIWNRNTGGSPQIKAQGNYFGACDGGVAPTCWNGSVDVINPLCAAPQSVRRPQIAVVNDPAGFRVLGARPNPTPGRGSTISYRLEGGSTEIAMRVFDVSGRLVRDLGMSRGTPGDNEVYWNGRGDDGQRVARGIYLVHAIAKGLGSQTVKVLVSR